MICSLPRRRLPAQTDSVFNGTYCQYELPKRPASTFARDALFQSIRTAKATGTLNATGLSVEASNHDRLNTEDVRVFNGVANESPTAGLLTPESAGRLAHAVMCPMEWKN